MITRVDNIEDANKCDELLTKLIQDECNYDDSLDKDFVVKDYFKNVIKNDNHVLLCYKDNEIIEGYIYLKPIEKGYLIDGLYVEEESRHKGIATKLLEEALIILKNKGIDFIDINVLSQNKVAVELYKKFGFNEFRIGLRKDL